MSKGSHGGKSGGGGGLSNKAKNTAPAENYTTPDHTVRRVDTENFTIKNIINSYQQVFDVTAKGNGEISITPAEFEIVGGSRKWKTVEYRTKGAYINVVGESGDADHTSTPIIKGINFNNVKSISGKTYDVKDILKNEGFEWDGKSKKWVKRN